MRGYNKNNISLNPSLPPWGIPSFLIYTQRKGTPPSPLPPCGPLLYRKAIHPIIYIL